MKRAVLTAVAVMFLLTGCHSTHKKQIPEALVPDVRVEKQTLRVGDRILIAGGKWDDKWDLVEWESTDPSILSVIGHKDAFIGEAKGLRPGKVGVIITFNKEISLIVRLEVTK